MSKSDLGRYFPRNGACLCHRTRYARHRVVDAIKERHRAGDSIVLLMGEYGVPRAAIRAALNSTPDDNRMTRREIREWTIVSGTVTVRWK